MNFFNVGFVLCAVNFNLGYIVTYALKLIGGLFMIGGVKESQIINDSFSKFKPHIYVALAFSAVGTVCTSLMAANIINGSAENIVSIIIGSLTTLSVLYCQRAILKEIVPDHGLVNDPSLLHALSKAWNKMAFFSLLTLLCDILYRLLPLGTAQNLAGTVQVISMIAAYFYVAIMGRNFNRVRMDFNVMHPV